MAHNPQAPQGPQGGHDPAGSTQMFRAFVDEDGPRPPAATPSSGPRIGLIAGIVVAVLVIAGVVWFALS
ncbi:hypothetical protein CUT44_18455 [Streptomyces carminius]|uniref:Uncharacterized protein n=1 Tax=Streptomyces carminius TaxID=2665496 RepID=A0A2M8LWZ3_9ACTN|nr:hypothetical protein [Streptomyces carminius]PJE96478.1 hypothetical protein CUT44_18455 [Streptomyces carminius]